MKGSRVILLLVVFLIVFTGFVSASEKEEIKEYAVDIMSTLVFSHRKSEGNFNYCVVPILPQHLIAINYPTYLEKRYTKQQIMQKVENR